MAETDFPPVATTGSFLDAVQKAAQMLTLVLSIMVEQAGPESWLSSLALSACLLAQL